MNRAFTNQLLAALARVLKPVGFSRRGSLFSRRVEDVVHLIQLQKSQSSSADYVKATINLAVWVPALAFGSASAAGAPVRARLGSIMPEHEDLWWELSSSESADESIASLVQPLVSYGLPWLQALRSSVEVQRLWQSGVSPGLTGLQRQRYLAELSQSSTTTPST